MLLLLLPVLMLVAHASEGSLLSSSESSLLGSLMHSAFLFDHLHDDYVRESVLTHPYLSRLPRSIEDNTTNMNNIFNSTLSSSKRRSLAYDKDNKILGIDVCLEKDKLYNLPYIELEFNFKIPVTQVFEDTFFNIEIPHKIETDIFSITDVPCAKDEWNNKIEPVLVQVEELVSMLGVDGRGCIMRAVCELAASPITRPDGIVGELLEVFFDHISSIEFAAIEKVNYWEKDKSEKDESKWMIVKKDKTEKDESEKDESEKDESEKDDSQNSKQDKNTSKQALQKKNNKLEKKNKSNLDLDEEPENNKKDSSFIEDSLLNSEDPLSKFDDILQELENEINLKRSRRDYISAAIKGRSNVDCQEHYSTCPISLFKLASQEDY